MERYTTQRIRETANRLGLEITVHSPGDRYGRRFSFHLPGNRETGGLGREVGYATGGRQAMYFLRAFEEGIRRAQEAYGIKA